MARPFYEKLRNRRKPKPKWRPPDLTIRQILGWADEWHARTGRWPRIESGPIPLSQGEHWRKIDVALRTGGRGLSGKSSLPRLLAKERNVRVGRHAPRLTESLILFWAEAHHRRTGRWPTQWSGPVLDRSQEVWANIQTALMDGFRGLPGGSSLAGLLKNRRGVRTIADLPTLSVRKILAWADDHRKRTGAWPIRSSGLIPESGGEKWHNVDNALSQGLRGFPGGSSLPKLLAEKRRVRNRMALPAYSEAGILAWADRHFRRTGRWPTYYSGPVVGAPGENWSKVHAALYVGTRGMPGGTTLAEFLTIHRGVRNHMALPALTEQQIFAWAKAHFGRTGSWPTRKSGPIAEAPGESWQQVNQALARGRRGLPGGSSVLKLLEGRRAGGER